MQATLKDIIRTNRDRLFIVDPECYIIFTGDSLEDTLPFIRVGNWINMPVELIPLIENIIITDSILGNPSHEQFNIDVRYLETNKYIGSENIVKRYLDFQNIFGLDLQNASIVNIEKDIPELSAQKNISKNHFMGVFYRDGNFKTVYHGKDIIDVKDIETKDLNLTTIQKKISAQSRKTERYAGAGIVILKHNPIFYNNNFFTSYLFPPTYFEDFSRLSINPEKIREILFPSSNLINLSRFLKWKNNTEGKVTIFSDHDEQLAKVKKLFSKSRIKLEEFDGLGHNTGDGLYIKNYKNTFNIKLVYESVGPAFRPLTISFIKSATGTKQIVKDDLDAIFITYSAYEDTNLFFKATKTPAAIIYDGNRNISRLEGSDTVILYPRIQYNFERHDRIETIYNSLDINEDILSILVNEDISRVETIPTEIILALEAEESSTADSSTRSELEKNIAIYNIASLVRVFIYTISNRKFSAKLKNIYLQLNKMIKTKELFSDISKIAVTLIFYNESIFQFISLREKSTKAQFLDEIPLLPEDEYFTRQDLPGVAPHDLDYYNKIREDRIRLIKLLNLFVNGPAFSGERKNEMTLLKQAIEERKKLYADDFYVNTAVDLEEKQGLAAITDSIKKLFSKDPHRAVPGEEVYVPGEEPGTMADHELKSGVGLSDMNAILNKNQGEDGPGAAEKLPGESDKEYALRLRKDVEKLTGTGGALEKLSGESDSEHAARLRDYIKELASSHEVPEQRSGETDREYTERLRDHVQELVRTRKTPEKILGENDNEYASRLYDYIDKLSGGAGLLKKMPGESYNEYVYRLRMYVEELTAPDGVLEKLAGEKDTDYAKRLRRYAEKLAGTGEALKKLPGEKNTDYAKRLRMFIEELTGVNGVLDPEHNETDTQYAERLLGYLEELTDSIGLQEKLPYESGSEYAFRLERDAKKISRIAGAPEKLPAETDKEYSVRLRHYAENLSETGETLRKKKGESDKDYALRLQRKAEKLARPGSVLGKLPGETDKEHAARLLDYIEELLSTDRTPERLPGETDREYSKRLRHHAQELLRNRKTPEQIPGENVNEYASRLYDYIDELSGGTGLLEKMPGESYNEYVYRLRMYVEELTAPDGVLEKLAGEKDTDYTKRLRRYAEKLAGTGEALKKLPGEKNTDYAKRLRMFIEELTGVNGVLDPEHNETDTQYAERLLGYLEELTDSIGLQEKLPYESGSEYVFRLERDAKKISRIAGVPEKLPAETDSEYTVRLRRYVENLSGTGKTLKKKKGENDKDYALRLQRKAEKLAGPGSVLEKLPGESDKDYAVRLRRYMEKFSKAKKALFPSRAYTTGTGLKEDTPEELLKKKKAWRKRNLAAAAAILILISALLVVNREKITGSLEELGLIEGKKGLKNGPGEDTAAGAEGNGTEESGNGPHAESGPGEDSAAGVEGSANVSPKIPDGETRKKITVEEDTIIDKYKISVNNFDIYTYANKVAVKNGYNSLSYPKLKHKNPNWIYPENIFIMLDGEKIFVKERDTLWRLARIKLTRMGIHFYELTEKIEKADDSDKRGLLDQAEKYAFKEKHYKIIAELKSKLE